MKNLISIVIPVYNVERLLERCVNSIVNQNYKNLEIILVDDGSLDNSPKICDELAKKDKRIKVIHKRNEGVSKARNEGVKFSTGDFITFVDSDDYIDLNFSTFVEKSIKEDCDISYSLIKKFLKKQKEKSIKNFTSEDLIYCAKTKVPFCCCGKLIKSKFIKDNNLFFLPTINGEDLELSMRCFNNIKSIYISDISFYNYETTEASASKNKEFKYLQSAVENFSTAFKIVDSYNYSSKAKRKMKSYIINNLYYMFGINGRFKSSFNEKYNLFKNNKNLFVKPSYFKFKLIFYVIKLFGIKISLKLFSKVIK